MHEITVIGLGANQNDLSVTAKEIIDSAKVVVLRTLLTESAKNVKSFKPSAISLDSVYEKSRNFDTLNKNLAKEVLALSKDAPVVYAVDGCALEDNSVKYLIEKRPDIKVIAGVSAGATCLERAREVCVNYTLVSAYEVENNYELTLPLIVYAIDSKLIASAVKLWLSKLFGDDVPCVITSSRGAEKTELYTLDWKNDFDYSTSVYIPKLPLTQKRRFTLNDLFEILSVLRSPNGCPWDREQTETSILPNLIEESYELLSAVESGNDFDIIEETGDVILQTAFYVTFGEEGSRFDRYDVLSDLCSKLITRHTHVFGNDKAEVSDDALSVWNKNKAIEKGYSSGEEYLSAVPTSMPAVMRAEKVSKRASKYNFDFANIDDAVKKIFEEVNELKLSLIDGNEEEISNECGDLLFSAVNVVRKAGVNAELALKRSTEKFINRFAKLEKEVARQGKTMQDLSASELDKIYESVKNGN